MEFPWTTTADEVVFQIHSNKFYNNYLEAFRGKKLSIEPGNVHEFFQNHKEKLKTERWVLVKAKLKNI